MRRLGVLTNAGSGSNRHGLARIDTAARAAGVPHIVTTDAAETEPALRALATHGVDVLAINGGDGTLHTTLSLLRSRAIFQREPAFALLASGTTNLVQRDVGVAGSPPRALERLAAACRNGGPGGRIVSRPVIAVRRAGTRDAAYGFFFGAAAVPRTIRAVRRRLHPRGLDGPIGEGLALGWLTWRLLTARVENDPLLHPVKLAYDLDGQGWRDGRVVLFLATTLERLVLGLRPVAPGGGLGIVTLSSPYRRLWRALPRLAAGRLEETTDGLARANARHVTICTQGSYLLDGEIFPPPRATPIRLEVAAPARFLKL